jgi:hypothetical protein
MSTIARNYENREIHLKAFFKALCIALFVFPCLAVTPQTSDINSTTAAISWRTQAHGVYFSLTQILPEQARAFFVNRGFTLSEIEPYASSCLYMTVLRNDNAPGAIHFVRDNWSVLVDGKAHTLVSVEQWVLRLTTASTQKSALVAFRWGQFPPEQEYEPGGDWNQGMWSVGLPPGQRFNAIARWDVDGKPYQAKLQGVECAG